MPPLSLFLPCHIIYVIWDDNEEFNSGLVLKFWFTIILGSHPIGASFRLFIKFYMEKCHLKNNNEKNFGIVIGFIASIYTVKTSKSPRHKTFGSLHGPKEIRILEIGAFSSGPCSFHVEWHIGLKFVLVLFYRCSFHWVPNESWPITYLWLQLSYK